MQKDKAVTVARRTAYHCMNQLLSFDTFSSPIAGQGNCIKTLPGLFEQMVDFVKG
jgi:hypothetical protein